MNHGPSPAKGLNTVSDSTRPLGVSIHDENTENSDDNELTLSFVHDTFRAYFIAMKLYIALRDDEDSSALLNTVKEKDSELVQGISKQKDRGLTSFLQILIFLISILMNS